MNSARSNKVQPVNNTLSTEDNKSWLETMYQASNK
jgi:hypothetical protein